MKISEVMTTPVVTVEMDDSLRQISEIMTKARFHHLPVVENGRLCGMISDRDILKATSPFLDTLAETQRDVAILNKKAHQIMTRDPVTVSVETGIEEAMLVLLNAGISCLPVQSKDGRLAGIVTWKDLIKNFATKLKSLFGE